jgi:hypothetical protein
MKTGIAIFRTAPTTFEDPEAYRPHISKLPLNSLVVETSQKIPLTWSWNLLQMGTDYRMERVAMLTLHSNDVIKDIMDMTIQYLQTLQPDRVFLRTFGEFDIAGPLIEVIGDLLHHMYNLSFISSIGEMMREKSITRTIFSTVKNRLSYVPIISQVKLITVETVLLMKHVNHDKPFTAFVVPVEHSNTQVVQWIKNVLIPGGVEEVIYPSLRFSDPILFQFTEEVMAKKSSPKKVVKVTPLAQPAYYGPTAPVQDGFPKMGVVQKVLSKRSTTSLNSTIIGEPLKPGDKVLFTRIIRLHEQLIFAQAKEGYFVVIHQNNEDYVTFPKEV